MSNIGFCDENLNADERNPRWLLDKGNEFFEKKNYLGAVSAYSSGIQLAKKSTALHLSRARAHFQLGNFKRCVCLNPIESFGQV